MVQTLTNQEMREQYGEPCEHLHTDVEIVVPYVGHGVGAHAHEAQIGVCLDCGIAI